MSTKSPSILEIEMIYTEEFDKVRIAKSGPNKLFEIDYDTRQAMDNKELINLFDRVSNVLYDCTKRAEIISKEEVDRRLLDKYHSYVDPEQEHRSFHYLKAEFIVQLKKVGSNQYKLTQLWRVASSDNHPKTLFINFDNIEEPKQFEILANSLGFEDEKLGLQLIRNFMKLHPNYYPIDSDTN